MSTSLRIARAEGAADLEAVRALCTEFISWNRVRYAHLGWLIERYYDPASWADYLASLPSLYAPPAGDILLARLDADPVGCVMVRSCDARTCEMKHLYVRAGARGHGIASALCTTVMTRAAEDGFAVIRLETGSLNEEAIALYRRLGFQTCDPWEDYPDDVRQHLRFMRRELPMKGERADAFQSDQR